MLKEVDENAFYHSWCFSENQRKNTGKETDQQSIINKSDMDQNTTDHKWVRILKEV